MSTLSALQLHPVLRRQNEGSRKLHFSFPLLEVGRQTAFNSTFHELLPHSESDARADNTVSSFVCLQGDIGRAVFAIPFRFASESRHLGLCRFRAHAALRILPAG